MNQENRYGIIYNVPRFNYQAETTLDTKTNKLIYWCSVSFNIKWTTIPYWTAVSNPVWGLFKCWIWVLWKKCFDKKYMEELTKKVS